MLCVYNQSSTCVLDPSWNLGNLYSCKIIRHFGYKSWVSIFYKLVDTVNFYKFCENTKDCIRGTFIFYMYRIDKNEKPTVQKFELKRKGNLMTHLKIVDDKI